VLYLRSLCQVRRSQNPPETIFSCSFRVISRVVLAQGKDKTKTNLDPRTGRWQSRAALLWGLATFILILSSACSQSARRSGMPAGARAVLDTSIEDIDAGRYEKLYHEAADEWRNDTTLDESKATFQRLHDKLGTVRTRSLESAREEQTSTAPIAGHSVVVLYQTSFEHGDGMEAFTLIEHGGHWFLARYYVTSIALK
jgi:hypothetical protein